MDGQGGLGGRRLRFALGPRRGCSDALFVFRKDAPQMDRQSACSRVQKNLPTVAYSAGRGGLWQLQPAVGTTDMWGDACFKICRSV